MKRYTKPKARFYITTFVLILFLLLSTQAKQSESNAFFMAQKEGGIWQQKADMATPREFFGTCALNGKIYAVGSCWGNINLATVEEYDPATDKWNTKANMNFARGCASAVSVNGKIYAIGGEDPNGNQYSYVEEYNPTTNKWVRKTDMPTARTGQCASVVNGKIYVIGGLVGNGYASIVEEYNPTTDTWTKKADMPTSRGASAIGVVNSKIYVIGGQQVFPSQANPVPALSAVEEYDPAIDKWTKKADMPTAISFASADTIGNNIYVVGGLAVAVGSIPFTEIYDPSTDMWTKGADMPTSRAFLSVSTTNGKLYAIGGATLNVAALASGPLLTTVEEYTPEDLQSAVSPQKKLIKAWGELKSK